MSTIYSQGFPGRSSAQQLLSQTAQVRANIQNVLLNGNAIPRIRPCPGDLILRTQKGRSWSRPNRQGLPLRNQANLRRQLALLTPNLIGNWTCNLGGTYYIKQWENRITWDGYSPNWNPSNPGRIKGTWHNRFQGWIQDNKVTIRGSWEDISDGSNRGRGTLVLNIGPAWRTINVISGQGNFFGSRTMTRVP